MKIGNVFWKIFFILFYKTRNKNIGKKSYVLKPIEVKDVNNIEIGNNSIVNHYSWILSFSSKKNASLKIGSNVRIGHFAHIVAKDSITIKDNVLIADKVFISDCTHKYENVNIPILEQEIEKISPIVIEEGCWIGENVCIIGASVGKNSVIGANSVVTQDIPDYCVATGAPAKIIKKYSFTSKRWESYN